MPRCKANLDERKMRRMKNLTRLFFLLIIFTGTSLAQEFNFGLSVGYSRTSPILEERSFKKSANPENYYNAMAIVEISTKSVVRMQTGLKYFKMGYTFEYNRDDVRYMVPPPLQSSNTLLFLAIPIDLNYSLPFLSGLYLSGGIEAAKVISANSIDYYNGGRTVENDITDTYRKLNFLLFVGFGIETEINNITLFIEPEYSRSLKGIIDTNALSNFEIEQISLNIGIKF